MAFLAFTIPKALRFEAATLFPTIYKFSYYRVVEPHHMTVDYIV